LEQTATLVVWHGEQLGRWSDAGCLAFTADAEE
jgi:hypothetical protein